MWATPVNGTRWCSHIDHSSMSRTRIISSWPASNVVVSTSSAEQPHAGQQLGVRPGDPGRGLAQPLAVGVLADRDQQLADGRLGAGLVEVGDVAAAAPG